MISKSILNKLSSLKMDPRVYGQIVHSVMLEGITLTKAISIVMHDETSFLAHRHYVRSKSTWDCIPEEYSTYEDVFTLVGQLHSQTVGNMLSLSFVNKKSIFNINPNLIFNYHES